ncbi:MAG: hypothetical protein CML33_09395 [Rhodobacteraceae bacterium]|nr:hypothetical protein [Paracoccaceae bacterium]
MKYLNEFEIQDAAEHVHHSFEFNSHWPSMFRVASEYLHETYETRPRRSLVALVINRARLIEQQYEMRAKQWGRS